MNKYTDQEFTYRQVPVSYDGIAKLDSIKGNTVAWNQLCDTNSIATSTVQGITYTNNNDGSWTVTGTSTGFSQGEISARVQAVVGHKYLFMGCPSGVPSGVSIRPYINGAPAGTSDRDTGNGVVLESTTASVLFCYITVSATGTAMNHKFYPMIIDLTMLGMDEVTDKASFQKYFSLPYYSYNQGTLVNFSGNGIKTVGKNLCPTFSSGTGANLTYTTNEDGSVHVTGTNTGTAFYSVQFTLPKGTYVLSGAPTNGQLTIRNASGGSAPSSEFSGQLDDYGSGATFTVSATASAWLNIRSTARTHDDTYYPMIRSVNADSTYEPYQSIVTDLPISVYFPNGLKSAGSVYDELTPSRAVTRIGAVDLGSLTWTYESSTNRAYTTGLSTVIKKAISSWTAGNLKTAFYANVSFEDLYGTTNDMLIAVNTSGNVSIRNTSFTSAADYTNGLSGVMLNYELATPTEQDINADLYYKFFGSGTEEILPSSLMNGSVDLGSLTWSYVSGGAGRFESNGIANIVKRPSATGTIANTFCPKYNSVSSDAIWNGDDGLAIRSTNGYIWVHDPSFGTDANAFKQAMQGVMLWFEMTDSTPSTSAFFGDITYYNTFESEVPYRKFWLVNGNGERWNFTENELKTFLNNPNGLGFKKALDLIRYGERAVKNSEVYDLPTVTGDLLFYDTANSSRYDRYNEFVRFLMDQPIKLYYQIPVSYSSQIADLYTLDCEVSELRKTESKPEGLLTSNITINGLSFYEGEEVVISGSSTTISIENKGDFAVGFELTIEGTMTNPYFTLEQDEELYGEGRFVDSTAFNSVYVNSNDGEQDLVLQQNGSILPNPLSYQDLSISNGAIYVTFVKLARGVSELKVRGGTISNVTVRFKPMFRSV